MDEATKRLADVILSSAQLAVVTIGALWAFWRFRLERTHVPRVDFNLDCRFYGPQNNEFIAEFLLSINNKGLVIHRFHDVLLRVRGIEEGQDLAFLKDNEPRLAFPVLLVNDNVIYKRKHSRIFVEPGINQTLTYVSKISSSVRFIVARVEFRYDQSRTYSVERVFELLPAAAPNNGMRPASR